jgi:hypothetical protein
MPFDPTCPACREQRQHTEDEWTLHPGEGRDGLDWNIPIKAEPTAEKREPRQ